MPADRRSTHASTSTHAPFSLVETPIPSTSAQAQLRHALSCLRELWQGEQQLVDARSVRRSKGSRVGQAAKTCARCRKIKAKCDNAGDGTDCVRCAGFGLRCDFPEEQRRGPKKQLSKNQRLLGQVERAIEGILEGGEPGEEDDEDDRLNLDEPDKAELDPPTEVDQVGLLLRNPLATLAHLSATQPSANPTARQPPRGFAQSYYDSGLYQPKPETDFSVDPVLAGILTHDDLERLLQLYFDKLRPFLWHLDPLIHTSTFLRLNSPFLTTALCAAVASFDPLSSHFAREMKDHARSLAVQAFAEGYKSIEVCQAYIFLAHWAEPEASWNEDRSWAWQGEALRIATEIRLDLPTDLALVRSYRMVGEPFDESALELFQRSQTRTWSLLSAGEIAMGIQTGRMEAIIGLSLPGGLKAVPPECAPTDADYNFHANEHANRIFARTLNLWAGLREEKQSENLRESFMSFWQPLFRGWWERWPSINPFIDIFAENLGIVLLLISLPFSGGSASPILAQCREAAIRTLQKAQRWEDERTQLVYASNFVIVNIAYSAVLLLQLSYFFDQHKMGELIASCVNVAAILDRIGHDRPNGLSIATLHAERIRTLVKALESEHRPAPLAPAAAGPINVRPSTPPFDFAPLPGWTTDGAWQEGFSSELMDFMSSMTSDPMLAGVWGEVDAYQANLS